jgi:hypothetical protein
MKSDNLDNLTIERAIEIIKTLTAERDEARELFCKLDAEDSLRDEGIEHIEDVEVAVLEAREREIADAYGWDLYKEDGK